VLRRICGSGGRLVKTADEELRNLYASPSTRMIKSRRMICAEHVAFMKEMRNSYKSSGGKPEGRPPFGRPRRRWEHNVRM